MGVVEDGFWRGWSLSLYESAGEAGGSWSAGRLEVALGGHVEELGSLGQLDGGAGVVDVVGLDTEAADAGLVAELGAEGLLAHGARAALLRAARAG